MLMKKFTFKIMTVMVFLLVGGSSFAQFKMQTKASIGQTLTVKDSLKGITTFAVNFNTDQVASSWSYDEATKKNRCFNFQM